MKNKVKLLLTTLVIFSCFLINIKGADASVYEQAEALVDKVCKAHDGSSTYCKKPVEKYAGQAQEYDYIAPINNISPNTSVGTENIQVQIYNTDEYPDPIVYSGSYTKYFVMSYAINNVEPDDKFLIKFGYGFDPKWPLLESKSNTFTKILSVTEKTLSARSWDDEKIGNNIYSVLSSAPNYIKVNLYNGNVAASNANEYYEYTSNMIAKLNLSAPNFRLKGYDDDEPDDSAFGDPSFSTDSNLVVKVDNTNTNSEVVMVSTKLKQKYNSTYFDKLVSTMMKYADTEDKFVKAYLNLSQIIDTGEYDTKSFTDLYYKATKDQMYSFMSDYLKSGITSGTVEKISKSEFSNWWDLTGRYILEDGDVGVKRFKDYFTFIFADPNSKDEKTGEYTKTRTIESEYAITLDQDSFELILKSINDMLVVKEVFEATDRVNDDNCLLYCTACIKDPKGSACSTCKTYNTSYKSCTTCRKEATDECKNVPSAGATYCYDGKFQTCLDKKIGKGAYQSFKDTKDKFYKDQENVLDSTIDDLIKNLEQLSLYDFVDIRWKKYTYTGDCNDVVVLRWVWLIITIGAPFLVIILGSIDYFKNVVFSKTSLELEVDPKAYEREWSTNKRKFVRRLVALLVLIALPIIIKLIIGNLAPKDSSASNLKLLNCIVNGK